MKNKVLLFIILIGISTFAYGQTKTDDILRLLKISGASEIAVQTMDALIPQFQQIVPDIPNVFWIRFMEKLDIEGLLDACVPAYDKHFSHDEIRQLINFYESPLGRRLVEATPLINQETMLIGQKWGEQLGHDIVVELIKEGYIQN